jgi:hypothetical protein
VLGIAVPLVTAGPLREQAEHGALLGQQAYDGVSRGSPSACREASERASLERRDHGRMHVALPADCHRISELLGDAFDGVPHGSLSAPAAGRRLDTRKQDGSSEGARPGSKRLGGEGPPHRASQVVVHVRGRDGAILAGLVDVLEQPLARQIAAALDDAGEPGVLNPRTIRLAALAAKAELDGPFLDARMPIEQGREAVGTIGLGVAIVSDANARLLEDAHHGREHLLLGQVSPG